MIPLFCLSLMLSGCNSNKSNELRKEIENHLIESGNDKYVDHIEIEYKSYENVDVYVVYIYETYDKIDGGKSYHINVYISNGDYNSLRWVYSK